jgi:hypothetical protein
MSTVRRFFAIAVFAGIARGHGSHAVKHEKSDATWDAEGYAAEHVCNPTAALFIRRAYIAIRCTRSTICMSRERPIPMPHQVSANALATNRDSFDLASFFQLHDLNRDGQWDKEEIEAVYGMHHEYSKSSSPNEQVQKERAAAVVKAVLDKVTTGSFSFLPPLSLTPVPD